MKKHLLLLFAALLPLVASAQTKVEIDGIWYNLVSKVKQAEVTNNGDGSYSGSITIPATVTYDGVAYSVTSIGDYAFYDCSYLYAITLPEGLTSIGEDAFVYCRSLTAVHISNIEAWCKIAFENYRSNPLSHAHNLYLNGELVTNLVIPEGVTSIGNYAFQDCRSLTAITIPEGVTSIGINAFQGCNSLTAITLPEGVTSIGEGAFRGCTSLTAINIPEGVTSIGEGAFRGCSSLTAITLPEGVTSIGKEAFNACSSLTAINIPEGVTSIGEWAFDYCSSLTAVHISNIEAWCKIAFENYRSNPLSHAHNLYLNGELVTNLVIPDGVTSIGNYAFEDCSSLTAITIPEGVTSLGIYAFYNCSSLTAINIPENSKLTSIGYGAFQYCSRLTAITLPEGVTSIGEYAFWDCSSLTSINIPENSKLTSIGDEAFYGCESLTAITLPEGVTSIGNYAFEDCTNLTAINIPEGVTSIGSGAFKGCSSLKELILGKGLKKIAVDAFSTCEALEKITIHATQPPRIEGKGNALFADTTYENATLYVPQGSISKYQVMTGWSGFYNISEMEGGTPDYLTIRQADNGAVGIAVDLGRTYKVCITPSTGWKVHTVTFNGTDITAQLKDDNTLTTPTITSSSELVVAYEKEGSTISHAQASRIKVQGHQGIISIAGATEGTDISLYTTSGTLVATATAEGESTQIAVPTGQVYIVKVADTVVKIGM